MSCENLDFESLSDLEYVKNGLNLYLNNEPLEAIEFLRKRSENSLLINYVWCLLQVFNALITLDKHKITEASTLLRELERKCLSEAPGWFKSIKTLFRNQRVLFTRKKSIIEDLERDIILADVLLCSAVLSIVEFDVSNYIKAALTLRRAHKIYHQTMRKIHELCSEYADESSPFDLSELSIAHNHDKFITFSLLQLPLILTMTYLVQHRNVIVQKVHLLCL